MISPRPCLVSSAFSSGTKVRCAAASEETPRMCTSFSTAWRAASAGVANSAPMSTSKPRSAAFVILELADEFLHPFDGIRHADLPPVDAGDGLDLRLMTTEHFFERQRNFADGGLGARGVDGKCQQIAVAARSVARERRQRLGDRLRIALALQPGELIDLQLPHGSIVDFENVD